MRAMHAIYEDGKITFPFSYPRYEGPLSVLVIFPHDDEEEFERELEDWDPYDSEIPY